MSRSIPMSSSQTSYILSPQSMQQSIENFLYLLQEQKKEENLLNKQIEELESQISNVKRSKSPLRSTNDLHREYFVYLKQVEASFSQINALQGENKILKAKIEDLRLENSKYKRIIGGLKQDINESTTMARSKSQSKIKNMALDTENKLKISHQLNKSTSEHSNLTDKISQLSSEIVQTKNNNILANKQHSELILQHINRPLTGLKSYTPLSKVLKNKLHNISKLKQNISNYCSKITNIKKLLKPIVKASGINDYLAISDEFTASYLQQKDMSLHLLKLNADIDYLKFSNKALTIAVSQMKKESVNENLITLSMKISKEANFAKRNCDILIKKDEILNKELEKSENFVDKIIEKFGWSVGKGRDEVGVRNNLEEKLEVIEQIVGEMINKTNISRESSGLADNAHVEERKNQIGLKSIKNYLETSEILEQNEPDDTSPKAISIFRFRAKKQLEKISIIRKSIQDQAVRSITPNPGLKKLL
ncbi:hypothetical protein SteCoe_30656 [Stentor coeruleus]|uniref:Uncharacterized protein n=1 Tax=Stentor coeruleus TaxID=5963 RepID=A0A1R2B330_9CILI|nr:hypothetical protein SteCoe_30656 [Stentor coeruleus]